MGKQESSVIKNALENLIEFISYTIEDLVEKAMFLDSKVGKEPFIEDDESILIRQRFREINELSEEFIKLAKDLSVEDLPEVEQEKLLNKFIEEKDELTRKRYRHLNY